MSEERRREERKDLELEAQLTIGRETLACTVRNLSRSGLLLYSPLRKGRLDKGAPCRVALSFGEGKRTEAQYRIVRIFDLQDGAVGLAVTLDEGETL